MNRPVGGTRGSSPGRRTASTAGSIRFPGLGLGFADQKVLEAAALFDALSSGVRPFADFHFATEVTAVVEAAERSAEQAIWMPIESATAGAGVA